MSQVYTVDKVPVRRGSYLSRRQRGGYVSVDELLQPDKHTRLPTTNLDINANYKITKNISLAEKVNNSADEVVPCGIAKEDILKRYPQKRSKLKLSPGRKDTIIPISDNFKSADKIQKIKISKHNFLSDTGENLSMRDWDQHSPREVAVLNRQDEDEKGLTQQRVNMPCNVLNDNNESHLHVDVCNSSEDGEIAVLSSSSVSFTDDEQLEESDRIIRRDTAQPDPTLVRTSFHVNASTRKRTGSVHNNIFSSVPTNSSNFPGCLYLPASSLKPYPLLMNSAGASPVLPRSTRPSPALGLYPLPFMFPPNSKTPCPHTASKPLPETMQNTGFSPIRPVPTCNLVRPCFNPNSHHTFPTMVPGPHLALPLRPISQSDAHRNTGPQHLAQLWARNALNLRPGNTEDRNNSENGRSSRTEPRRPTRKRHLSTESNNSDEDPEDALERRKQANARERERVSNLNSGFENLRQVLPWMNHNRRVSKVDTLRAAIAYIGHLQQTLWDAEWATHLQSYSQATVGFSHNAFRSPTMEPFPFQSMHPYSFIRPRQLPSFGPTAPIPTLSSEISAPGHT